MAIQVDFITSETRFTRKISSAIVKQLQSIASGGGPRLFPDHVELGTEVDVDAAEMIGKIRSIRQLIEGSPQSFPVSYSLKHTGGSVGWGMSFKSSGRFYFIRVGLGLCTLQETLVDANGKAAGRGEVIDIRNVESIDSDNGPIKIIRKGNAEDLLGFLGQIEQFLTRFPAGQLKLAIG